MLIFLQLKNLKVCCIINKKTLKYHIQEIDTRKIEIILLKINAPDELWKGTILNGKISKNNKTNEHYFIIQDCYYLFGSNLLEYEMKKKNEVLKKLKDRCLDNLCCKNFIFKINDIYEYNDLNYLIKEYIPKSDINCNGLFFQPNISGIDVVYLENRSQHNDSENRSNVIQNNKVKTDKKEILSINSYSLITNIDNFLKSRNYSYETNNKEKMFYMKKGLIPDVFELYELNKDEKVDIAIIPNLKTSHYCKENIIDGKMYKFKCIWYEKFKGWIPIKLYEETNNNSNIII